MEHVPPRSFFPDSKDERGNYQYRSGLIEVPSCNEHNNGKSGDDFYALWHIAPLEGTGEAARLLEVALGRQLEHDVVHRKGRFSGMLLKEIREADSTSLRGEVNVERMQRFIQSRARGAFFFEKFKKLLVPLKVVTIGNDIRDRSKAERLRKQEVLFETKMSGAARLGTHPECFEYSIREIGSEGVTLVRLVFFEAVTFWAYHYPGYRGA